MKITKVVAIDSPQWNEIQFLLEIDTVRMKRNWKIEIVCNNPLLWKKIEISPPNLNPKIYNICHI